jgi:hypothetical protein
MFSFPCLPCSNLTQFSSLGAGAPNGEPLNPVGFFEKVFFMKLIILFIITAPLIVLVQFGIEDPSIELLAAPTLRTALRTEFVHSLCLFLHFSENLPMKWGDLVLYLDNVHVG